MLANRKFKADLKALEKRTKSVNEKLTELVRKHKSGFWTLEELQESLKISLEVNNINKELTEMKNMSFIRRITYKG